MTKHLGDKYSYRVLWSEEDQEYVGLCVEFHSLSWLDKSPAKALTGILKLVNSTVAEMRKSGDTPPLPITSKKFSGIFKVRIPPLVHRNLAVEAAEAGISINRLVSAKLAHG